MTASADARPLPLATNGVRFDSRVESKMDSLGGHRPGQFKKHKVLPHPRTERVYGSHGTIAVPRTRPGKLDLDEVDRTLSQASVSQRSTSQPSISSVSLRRTPRRIAPGPDPPPTPPAHSRTSSSSHSALPSSPTYVATPIQSAESIRAPAPVPVTPTNQQSPPTPNLTPEQSPPAPALVDRRPKPRPVINDRIPSKMTTVTDSRTESFKTARENPESSSEEDGKSTVRPILPSARSSHSTVRQVSFGPEKPKRKTVGLGLGLESSPEDNITPRTKGEFMKFDGDWGSGDEVEEEWDDNLMRTVKVRKRFPVNGNGNEVVEDVTITPTNATKALRSSSLALQESPIVYPTRRVLSDRVKPSVGAASSTPRSSVNMDVRRLSGISTVSNVSTVVEAILVNSPPQRRKTLRHVRKQSGLRDSAADLSLTPSSSVLSSLPVTDSQRRPTTNGARVETRHESVASAGTYNSISSRKARREIVKNGGIPVVIIPDRRSSNKSSKEPSLRSTSSRRTKRSQSLISAPVSRESRSTERTPIFERPGRRSRTLSESDGSRPGDQRTMDFPPSIPPRSSSQSAPTSHNASRTGSLTADSLKAHNTLQAQRARKALESLATQGFQDARPGPKSPARAPEQTPRQSREGQNGSKTPEQRARSCESGGEKYHSEKDGLGNSPRVDRNGDPFFGNRLSVQRTPFSLASVETTGTFPEVSEAMAVNIYPHQNKSVLVVEHSNRPSENSSLEQKRYSLQDNPQIKATAPDSDIPVTPPQPTFSMEEVDSPLRNPRAPPEPPLEPPAIQFIPATPSGLTPMRDRERQLGNYFGEVVEKPKPRPMSLLRRTLTRRRLSEYGPSATWSPGAVTRPGLLARTFSLSRGTRKEPSGYFDPPREPMYPDPDDRPREENKLHPFWRPAYPERYPDHYGSRDGDDEYWEGDTPEDETYRYPPVDNRPPPPRRSLSSRMKRTFAILPSPHRHHEDHYPVDDEQEGTAQRTIRRTPSGNLRVVQHRRSLDSLRHYYSQGQRPYTAPDGATGRPGLWRTYSLSKTLGSKIEKFGLHNLPRRLSERKREKRSQELRQKISGPREVRDGVGDVIKRISYRENFNDRW